MNEEGLRRAFDGLHQLSGPGLVVIGLGWLAVARLPTGPPGLIDVVFSAIGGTLSGSAIGSAAYGVGLIHLLIGTLIVAHRYTGRPRSLSFSTAVGAGAIGFVASAAVGVYPDIVQEGTVVIGVMTSFPVFVCYVTAWLFPLGVATDRTQYLVVLAGVAAIPVLMGLALLVLLVSGGGWLILILLFSIPAVLVISLLTAVCGLPLVVAGRVIRHGTPT